MPAPSDDFNPTAPVSESVFQPAEAELSTQTPAQSAPSESEDNGISILPIQADADLLPVVGLGGSAGSLAALQAFFDAMPADSGLAFVVVLHLSPDFESQLSQVLQAHTQMPVINVGERQKVEANHVYVIPPGQHLEMQDGHIFLAPLENEFGKRVAVDLFFRSLAASQRSRAVAVVLSGLDSDGSIGIKRVKEHGGVTIAQDPDEAQHDGMPRSAIQTGMVDWVLPISALAPRLLEFWANEQRIQLPPGEAPPMPFSSLDLQSASENPLGDADEVALREILAFLLARTGHDFLHYKRATVLRRIGRRLQVNSLTNLPYYVAFLRTHNGEAGALLQDLLISVTNFFRDADAFAALETRVPALFKGKKAGDVVRVWVAGCATGEEAYSIAMLLVEHAGTLPSPPAIQVFATDIDDEATRTAREGRYPQAIAADVSPERLRRFFLLDHGCYRVRTELREMVLFASHNLLRDSPFSHLDLVTCRNLLIYFQNGAQERVFTLFHFALNPDGILFLGGSESSEEGDGLFAVLDKKHRIYGRRMGNRRQLHLANLPSPRAIALPDPQGAGRGGVAPGAGFSLRERAPVAPDFGELHLRLLEQWSPPSVLVTHNFDILHLSERAGRFMAFRGGVVSTNLLNVVHPALRLELRAALMSAAQEGQSVDVPGLPLELDGAARLVDLRVRPLRDDDHPGGAVNYLMVVFDDREAQGADMVLERSEDDVAVRRLERESGHLKAHLRSTVEQYEATTEELKASNEELQAMNEELRSAGEELETSKEELQAANEELLTINQEMKSKVEQLARSNGDLQNLMAATSIATIFFDRELCIQRYTPPAVELFNLIPTDTYRPLSDLRHSLRYDSMIEDAAQVIEHLQPIEREVSGEDGRWFLVRVLPYRSVEDRIDGVVFTFVDVSRRYEAELELRRSEERYRSLFTTIEEAFALCEIIVDEGGQAVDYRFIEVNPAFETATGISPAEAHLKTARELVPSLEDWWVETFGRVALTGEATRFENYVAELDRWFEAFASPVGERKNGRFALIFNDITPRKQQEAEVSRLLAQIEQQARVFNTTLTAINDFAYLFDRQGRFTYSNRPLLDLLGLSLEELIGKNFFDLGYPPELAARLQDEIQLVLETRKTIRSETSFVSPMSAEGFYEYIFNPVFALDESVEAVAGSTRDVTQRKRAEMGAALLGEISHDLGRLSDSAEILQVVGAKIGTYLQLSNCTWMEVDEAAGQAIATQDWHRQDVPSLLGTYRINEFVSGEFQRACRAGETFVVRDTQSDPRTDAAQYATIQAGAFVSVPLVRGGEWRFLLVAFESKARDWHRDEIDLITEVTARVWTRLERMRAESAQRDSDARYQQLFNSIDEGFCVLEMIFDEAEKPVDFLIIEANPAYERQSGNGISIGQTASEKFPTLDEFWFQTYSQVVLTGESVRFEHETPELNRWFEVYASRVGDNNSRKIAVVFQDITKRKQNEEAMRESEARIAADLAGMRRLYDLQSKLELQNDVKAALQDVLAAACEFTGTDRGSVQLLSADGERLEMAVWQGYEENSPFISFFRYEGLEAGCEVARVQRQRLIIEDTLVFAGLEGTEAGVAVAADAIRAAQSTPMANRLGETIGVISTQFRQPHRPSDYELRLMDMLAWTASEFLERHRADALLRESESRFRAMFEQANVGIVQATLEGYLHLPNPGFCKIIGYKESEARGLHFRQITHPDDYEREAELTREMIAGQIPGYSIEKRYVRKDGSIIWGEMTATLMRNAQEQPIFILSVIEDISERKAAQDAMRESQERLQVLLESVQDYAIITMTPDNCIESWNAAATKIFGWNETEILGQSGAALFTPEDREKGEPEREIESARREGRAADERWHLRKDGTKFYASGVMTVLRDDPRHGFVKILRDLTSQKQAEELLRASEQRFRTQADAVPQIIWTNDAIGAANGFNKRWFDYSGLTLEESLGLGWQKIVHPDDAFASTQRWLSALRAGDTFEAEYRLRDREGQYRWHIARNVPLRDSDDQILGWFGTATDIQEVKDAQEALRQSRDLLEERVEERTQTLQERTQSLQEEVVERLRLEEQSKQLMQRIVQVQEEERRRISRELHDNLGQHATAIMLSLQLLQDAESIEGQGERRQSAAQLVKLHSQMDELLSMTHRLAWELRPAILDNIGLEAALRQYLKEWSSPGIVADFESRLPNSDGAKAEIGLSPDAETALYRVVQEALTNVVRHSAATMVSVILERRADYVTAIVEDNGRGFDVEAISSSKRLGVRGMQERMDLVGGTLEVESQPEMGTTIYARVPLEVKEPTAQAAGHCGVLSEVSQG